MRAQARRAADVVVTIPAHNEAATIRACLRSVQIALGYAERKGWVRTAQLVLVANNCTDPTVDIARSVIGPDVDGVVVALDRAVDVGLVRDHGARIGLALLAPAVRPPWIFSTDADTVVPRDWLSSCLRLAARHRAAAIVGLAGLDAWRGSEEGKRRYDALLAAKTGTTSHQHVYGANLAVRSDAYLDVGGFPHQGHGEDQRLVDALDARGYSVVRSLSIKVTTSGRTVGRAPDGLADLLRRLDGPIPSPDLSERRPRGGRGERLTTRRS